MKRVPRIQGLLAACLLSVFAPGAGAAQDASTHARLATLVGELDLPFEHEVTLRELSIGMSSGLWASEQVTLLPSAGSWAGQEVRVRAYYFSPDSIDAGVVQGFVRSEAEQAAADPTTLAVEPLAVAGFDFNLIERVRKDDQTARRVTRLVGSINGAMVSVEILKPDDTAPDAALRAGLPALALDFGSLLRLRGQFERERERAVQGLRMSTPMGPLTSPKEVSPELMTVSVTRNGEGKVQYFAHNYLMQRGGLWTDQRLGLHVSCDHRANDPQLRTDAFDPFREEKTVTMVPGVTDELIGGFPAKLFRARRAKSEKLAETELQRWVAIAGDDILVAQIEQINGGPLARGLERQFREMKAACDPEGGPGIFATSGTGAAPGPTLKEVRE